ncbi:MAG: ABC transporter permease [Cytophagales bacterium]|nr:MAG: ABC transporter permease [Cytophagales bacterium]
MNLYRWIAQRLQQRGEKRFFGGIVSRIAIFSIAIGLVVMVLSFAVLRGYEQVIQQKIFSFAGHIQVSQYNTNNSYEGLPISKNTYLFKHHSKLSAVRHLHVYAHKAGILKVGNEVSGVVLKGIDRDYDTTFFAPNVLEGSLPYRDTAQTSVMISQKIAKKMQLKRNDTILMFFIQNPPKFRKLVVGGIYETGMEEFDEKFAFCHISLIQQLNRWGDTLVGGYEIFAHRFEKIPEAYQQVYENMDYDMQIDSAERRYLGLFDWLLLLNTNVSIILILILSVAAFNMLSILLVLIMERTQMIGVLKAIGATYWQISVIFIYQGYGLLLKGMLWGNLVAIFLVVLQYYFKLIPLDPENYYVNAVPVAWDFFSILYVNLLTLLLTTLVMIVPISVVAFTRPIRAIRFD